ncbi:MAG TPA: zinc-binding dehydrogenase [Thermoleophilaceae bacterium]|nr:zinc-binding dehydrogenase [Thermoleophilaceae bacterium]
MRALLARQSAPHGLELGEIDSPHPEHNEALVAVRAVSLNRGEARYLPRREEGTVHGWDVAGVVEQAAADGSGPAEGARVVGLVVEGAWAEQAAMRTDRLASLPDEVSFEDAATLPVAGMTAVRALEVAGPLLGRRVLVTGASGGVGRFAIQLARDGGAHVTGVSSSPERAEGLAEIGANEVVGELSAEGEPFDVILESVGGASLAAAIARVAPWGTIVTFGNSSSEQTTFDVSPFYALPGARLIGLRVFDELDRYGSGVRDLRFLAEGVAAGRLDTQIGVTRSWREAGETLEDLIERRVRGKAVLTID